MSVRSRRCPRSTQRPAPSGDAAPAVRSARKSSPARQVACANSNRCYPMPIAEACRSTCPTGANSAVEYAPCPRTEARIPCNLWTDWVPIDVHCMSMALSMNRSRLGPAETLQQQDARDLHQDAAPSTTVVALVKRGLGVRVASPALWSGNSQLGMLLGRELISHSSRCRGEAAWDQVAVSGLGVTRPVW